MSATGSPASVRSLCQVISAPISASVVNRPVRFGFMPIPVSVTSEFSEIAAATAAKAAELGSPGTITGHAISSGCPVRVIWAALSASWVMVTVAPKWVSINSVWSRVGCGSITVVLPGVFNPASRTADFTCAEATGNR